MSSTAVRQKILISSFQMQSMFRGAAAFNQPLSFDTAAVTNVSAYACFESDDSNEKPDSDFLFPTLQMHSMFYKAVAFNQDLRHFGDYFSQISLVDIFWNSGCSNKNVPTSVAGPWCACYRFTTTSELRTAIQEYLSLEQNCATNVTCQARSDYGGAVSIVLRSSLV